MAIAKNTFRSYEEGDINTFGVKATSQIYIGSIVGSSGGYARGLVAADVFLGFSLENVLGGAADGAVSVNVQRRGAVQIALASLAVTDIGKKVYASDDGTFTLTAMSNSYIGTVLRWVSTGIGILSFDAGANAPPV